MSNVNGVSVPGMLSLGTDPELREAIRIIAEDHQSAADKHNLLPHLQKVREAMDQAAQSPEGVAFLAARPKLRQRLADLRQNLNR